MEKKFLFMRGVSLLFALAAAQAFGAVYYVATDGSDSAAGSKEKPFASLNKANSVVHAGDTVWIRGGIYDLNDTVYVKSYQMTAGIHLTASGENDDNRIHYLAYPGERPIFDGSNLPVGVACQHKGSTIDSVMTTSSIVIEAKYLHLKGFEVRNTPMVCNSNAGIFFYYSKHIFLEQIDSHHNAGAGFFVHDGASGGGGHFFLNCDAHDNYDPTGWQGDGENADGFGVHYQTDGDTTKFYGCRSWWNSDDGWDVLAQEFPVVVENSYSMGNGYIKYGTTTTKSANGNGFKMGPSRNNVGRHTIKNCVAWNNKANGFYANYSSIGSYWYNNTSYQNGDRSFSMPGRSYSYENSKYVQTTNITVLMGDEANVLKNNLAFPNKLSQIGKCSAGEKLEQVVECPAGEYNSWNLDLTLDESDFVSLDDPSMTVTGEDLSKIPGMLGPRNADGSLPYSDFLKLKKGSRAIDKGEDLGFEFEGEAPDLGAFEYGVPVSSAAMSSSSETVPSSSASDPSSSSSGTTSIAMKFATAAMAQSAANVFDLQGRYLGTLQAEPLQSGNLAQILRAQFKNPGMYLIRCGNELQKVNVK